jgi:hypothetical protein
VTPTDEFEETGMSATIIQPDWPPARSAIGLQDGERHYGSTGQLFEVRNQQWVRVRSDLERHESDPPPSDKPMEHC